MGTGSNRARVLGAQKLGGQQLDDPEALRTQMLRLLGPKAISYRVFGLFCALGLDSKGLGGGSRVNSAPFPRLGGWRIALLQLSRFYCKRASSFDFMAMAWQHAVWPDAPKANNDNTRNVTPSDKASNLGRESNANKRLRRHGYGSFQTSRALV